MLPVRPASRRPPGRRVRWGLTGLLDCPVRRARQCRAARPGSACPAGWAVRPELWPDPLAGSPDLLAGSPDCLVILAGLMTVRADRLAGADQAVALAAGATDLAALLYRADRRARCLARD